MYVGSYLKDLCRISKLLDFSISNKCRNHIIKCVIVGRDEPILPAKFLEK